MNPTDPNSGSVMIECGLPAVVGGIGGGAKLPAMVGGAKVPATPAESETKEKSNKKGMLYNMSTSDTISFHPEIIVKLLYSLKFSRDKIFVGQRMATKFFSREISSS